MPSVVPRSPRRCATQRVLGAAGAQRLRAEPRERRDLDRAAARFLGFRLRAREQLRRDERRRPETRSSASQSSGLPIAELAVRRLEVVVDEKKPSAREREAERASAAALAPRMMSRYTSTTCDLIDLPRTLHHHARVANRPLTVIQTSDHVHRRRGERDMDSARQLDAVADAGLGDDDLRRRRIDLDLAAEIRDVHAQILLRTAELRPHTASKICWCVSVRPADAEKRAQASATRSASGEAASPRATRAR